MKRFKCYDCEEVFEAESSKDMLELLYPHYMSEHEEEIKGATEDEKKAWMQRFNKDWEAAEEV